MCCSPHTQQTTGPIITDQIKQEERCKKASGWKTFKNTKCDFVRNTVSEVRLMKNSEKQDKTVLPIAKRMITIVTF